MADPSSRSTLWRARTTADDQRQAEQERAAELTRWHHDDEATRGTAAEDGINADSAWSGDPVLER